jgi:hypothetical protein
VLFGNEAPQFEQSSKNAFISAPTEESTFRTSEDRVHPVLAGTDGRSRDFYGEAAEKYGVNNNKRDGALMAQGVDWKNSYHKPIDADPLIKSQNLASKDRKYQNL